MAYVVGKKDEVELVGTGKGLGTLKQKFPTNRIFFCPVALNQNVRLSSSIFSFSRSCLI